MSEIDIWNPKFVRGEHFRLSILSPSETGKSYMIRHLFEKHHFDEVFDLFVVFSKSLDNAIDQDFFASFVPGKLQFNGYKPEVVVKLFEVQDKHMSEHGKFLNVLIIFDDCVSTKNKYSDEILQIFIRGRNKGSV